MVRLTLPGTGLLGLRSAGGCFLPACTPGPLPTLSARPTQGPVVDPHTAGIPQDPRPRPEEITSQVTV